MPPVPNTFAKCFEEASYSKISRLRAEVGPTTDGCLELVRLTCQMRRGDRVEQGRKRGKDDEERDRELEVGPFHRRGALNINRVLLPAKVCKHS